MTLQFENDLEEAIETYREQTSEMEPDQLTQLLDVESLWEAEGQLLETLPRKLEDDGRIDERTDLEAIALWKFPIVVRYVRDAPIETIRDISRQAFATNDITARVTSLTKLPGVGPSMATTIEMFRDPDSYTVMDPRATRALTTYGYWDGPTEASLPHYRAYLETCREIATTTGFTLRDVDRGLFVLGGE
ncbi:hypothetical protein [Natronoglomus mannanivorans]|uniref:Uncharacterized protein n=1 Tax=Natronoglomus mannanivorans TaxID=2979990 RepID=A0AAP3E4S2_9EURY|nr:hypothetical protein [Halobacteria archaeon AArc-xg1-1]